MPEWYTDACIKEYEEKIRKFPMDMLKYDNYRISYERLLHAKEYWEYIKQDPFGMHPKYNRIGMPLYK